jgi:hypothetical protein
MTMDPKLSVTLNCPHYWPKLKPEFPCEDCTYDDILCADECPRFQARREALGAEFGTCETCEYGETTCVWQDPPPELRAMLDENAPDWQVRRWVKEYYSGRK